MAFAFTDGLIELNEMKYIKLVSLYVKAKCTLVLQALRLCTGHTAHRWSRDIAVLFLDQGTRRG